MGRLRFTDEQLLAAVREIEAEQPGVTQTEFCRAVGVSHALVHRRFGRWPDFRERAGLPRFVQRPPAGRISDDEIRDALRRAVAEFGEDLRVVDFIKFSGVTRAQIAFRFGSWTELRKAAGLSPFPRSPAPPRIPDEEIRAQYRFTRKWIGRHPTFRELALFTAYSESTYRRRFELFRIRKKLRKRCEEAARRRLADHAAANPPANQPAKNTPPPGPPKTNGTAGSDAAE